MFFSEKESYERKLNNSPRLNYEHAAKFFRKINFILMLFTLCMLLINFGLFLNELNKDKVAYFTKSSGEFRAAQYSKSMNEVIRLKLDEYKRK